MRAVVGYAVRLGLVVLLPRQGDVLLGIGGDLERGGVHASLGDAVVSRDFVRAAVVENVIQAEVDFRLRLRLARKTDVALSAVFEDEGMKVPGVPVLRAGLWIPHSSGLR